MVSSTDVRILGPLAVVHAERAIDLGSPKQRAVFAVLVINANSIVSSDRIIEEVWADGAPKTAGHSVQIYVSELRKALGSTDLRIDTRPPGYILHTPRETVDAHRFEEKVLAGLKETNPDAAAESLLGGMQLWRGDPLADFTYDDFAQHSIRRLRELHSQAAERLAELNLESGHPQAALSWLDRIDIERLRERGQHLRMLALYRAGRQVDSLRSFADYRRGLAEVGLTPSPGLLDLEDMIINRDAALGLRPERGPNPYKGLRAFTSEDSGQLFGRDALTSEIAGRLLTGQSFVAVVGPSGSGKSSVVRAGVIPALESELWSVAIMTPGDDPLRRLDRVLGDTKGRRLVIVDQFEEAFTICETQESARFLTRLAGLAGEPLTSVLVAIRADHLDAPLRAARFSKLFATGVVPVLPMSEAELREAISKPAEAAGVAVEPALVERLIADMEDQPGALPLMQFTLTELFDATTSDSMSLEGYLQLGGLRGALAKRADEIHDSLGLTDRASLRRLLLNLTYATKAGIRRRSVPLGDLLSSGRPEIERLIETLTVHRLVTRDRNPLTGEATVDIAHEALLEEWERLRRWITTYRADLERREALTLRAMDWEESGKDPAYLLRGSALSVYETWAHNSEMHLSDLPTAYLAASSMVRAQLEAEAETRAEAVRQAARRARRRMVAIGGLVAVVAAATTYGLRFTIASVFNPPPEVVHIIGPGDETDAGFIETAHAGFLQGLDETGLEGELGIVSPGTWPSDEIEAQAARGVGLILVSGSWMRDEIALAHPGIHFAVWDTAGDLPNVTYNSFKEQEGSFLVGAAAALRSKSGTIGFLGGVDLPVIGQFEAGYTAGAKAVNPDVVVETRYLTDWYDHTGFQSPSRAKQVATEMYTAGADVIFHAAGFSGIGLFDAAAEQSAVLGRHLWAIGVDADQYLTVDGVDELGPWDPEKWKPHILTSMLKRLDTVTAVNLKDYAAGRLEGGSRVFGLAEGGVDYSRSGGFIEDIVDQLEAFRRDIISGRIVVPSVPEGRIYELPG